MSDRSIPKNENIEGRDARASTYGSKDDINDIETRSNTEANRNVGGSRKRKGKGKKKKGIRKSKKH